MRAKCKTLIQTAVGHLAACMEPLMPMIIAGSLTKLLCIFIGMLVKTGTTKEILTIIGDAPFYFLPVLVAITASDHFKIDRFYAIVAAGVLLMPSLTALMTGSENVFLFGIPVVKASYSYSILPVILLIWLTSKFLPFLTKAFPKCLMDNLYPVVVLLIMSTLGILVVGPAATLVSNGIVSGLSWLAEHAGFLAWPLLAGTSICFIMTGTGLLLDALVITQISTFGIENGIMAAMCILNLALTGADFALALRRKNTELAGRAWSCGITALLVGVAEPSVFGICIKNKTIFRNVVISCVLAGIFQGIVTINSYVFSFPGLCAVLMFYSPDRPSNLIYALIVMIIAFVVSFLLNFLTLGKENPEVTQ